MTERKKPDKKAVDPFFHLYEKEKCAKTFQAVKMITSIKSTEEEAEELSLTSPEDHSTPTSIVGEAVASNIKNLQVSEIKQCSYCRAEFHSSEDQRNHYKEDWHRYNLKLNIEGRPPVTETEFIRLVEDMEEDGDNLSISGSESEEDSPEMEEFSRNPKFFLRNAKNQVFSVYKTLLVDPKLKTVPHDNQLQSMLDKAEVSWTILMLGGGHFAGAVFKGNQVLVHKTFHCYTVRAKQGGSQSAADNRSGGHKSAGASLRRYNEQALIQHVQDITKLWATEIGASSLIFFRASSGNRNVLFGGKSPAISRGDSRLRTIPFPTKRATFSEVKRVMELLSKVDLIHDVKNILPSKKEKIKDRMRIHRSKSRESPTRTLPADIPEDSSEDESAELSLAREVHSTLHLKEFETDFGKPRKRKKNKKKAAAEAADAKDVGDDADAKTAVGDNSVDEEIKARKVQLENQFLTAVRTGNLRDLDNCIEVLTNHEREEEESSNQIIEQLANENTNEEKLANKKLEQEKSANEKQEQEKTKNLNFSENLVNQEKDEQAISKTVLELVNKQYGEGKLTFLHLAAQAGHRSVISRLLQVGADPSTRDKSKRVPYSLAADKETRNAFRKSQALFPTRYDWKGAQVPPPLSKAEEEEKERKVNEKKKAKRQEKKEKEKAVKAIENAKMAEEKETARFLRLSDREKRALAAERRIAATSSSNIVLLRCFLCGKDITGKVPFTYSEYSFCSPACVRKHREAKS